MLQQTEFSGDRATAADLDCIVYHALQEHEQTGISLPELLGLKSADLIKLTNLYLPGLDLSIEDEVPLPLSNEQGSITTLILWRGKRTDQEARWLSQILARRAMEPHHLWEDLGLPSRDRLNTMMEREFPALFAMRPANMRWKKFLYRQICSDPGHTVCPAPTCDACSEYKECFAPA